MFWSSGGREEARSGGMMRATQTRDGIGDLLAALKTSEQVLVALAKYDERDQAIEQLEGEIRGEQQRLVQVLKALLAVSKLRADQLVDELGAALAASESRASGRTE